MDYAKESLRLHNAVGRQDRSHLHRTRAPPRTTCPWPTPLAWPQPCLEIQKDVNKSL